MWELPQKDLINLSAGRAPYIDQSQSLNIYIKDPSFSKISAMHFYGWEKGLKTGMYYLRSRPATNAIKFTVDVEALIKESCEGIELKHFNSKASGEIPNPPPSQNPPVSDSVGKACPLRRKKKPEDGDSKAQDEEECLACGS